MKISRELPANLPIWSRCIALPGSSAAGPVEKGSGAPQRVQVHVQNIDPETNIDWRSERNKLESVMEPPTRETSPISNTSIQDTSRALHATANLLSRFDRAEQHHQDASRFPSDMHQSQQPQHVPMTDPSPMPSPYSEDAVCTIGHNITDMRAEHMTPPTLLHTTTRRTLCAQFEQMSVTMTTPNHPEDALEARDSSPVQGGAPMVEKFDQAQPSKDPEPEYDSPELLPWGQSNGWKRPAIKEGIHEAAVLNAQAKDTAAPVANAESQVPPKASKEAQHAVPKTKATAAAKATGAAKPTAAAKAAAPGRLAIAVKAIASAKPPAAAKGALPARIVSAKTTVPTKAAAAARPVPSIKLTIPAKQPHFPVPESPKPAQLPGPKSPKPAQVPGPKSPKPAQVPAPKLQRPAQVTSAFVKRAVPAGSAPAPVRKTGQVVPKPAVQTMTTKPLPAAIKRQPTVAASSKPSASANAGRLTGLTLVKEAPKPPLFKSSQPVTSKVAASSFSQPSVLMKKVQPSLVQRDLLRRPKPLTKAMQPGLQREQKPTIRPPVLKTSKQSAAKLGVPGAKIPQQNSKKLPAGKVLPQAATSQTAPPPAEVEATAVVPIEAAVPAAAGILAVGHSSMPPPSDPMAASAVLMGTQSAADVGSGLAATVGSELAAEVGSEVPVEVGSESADVRPQPAAEVGCELAAEVGSQPAVESGIQSTFEVGSQLASDGAGSELAAGVGSELAAQMDVESGFPVAMEVGGACVHKSEAVVADEDSPMEMDLGSPVPAANAAAPFLHVAQAAAAVPFAHAISAASELQSSMALRRSVADEDTAMSPAHDWPMADDGDNAQRAGFPVSHVVALSSDLFGLASSTHEQDDSECSSGAVLSGVKEKIVEIVSAESVAPIEAAAAAVPPPAAAVPAAVPVAVAQAATAAVTAPVAAGEVAMATALKIQGADEEEEGNALVETEFVGLKHAGFDLEDCTAVEEDLEEEEVDEEDDIGEHEYEEDEEADEQDEVEESEFVHEREDVQLARAELQHVQNVFAHARESFEDRQQCTEPEPIMLVPYDSSSVSGTDGADDLAGDDLSMLSEGADDVEAATAAAAAADVGVEKAEWQQTAVLLPRDSNNWAAGDSAQVGVQQHSHFASVDFAEVSVQQQGQYASGDSAEASVQQHSYFSASEAAQVSVHQHDQQTPSQAFESARESFSTGLVSELSLGAPPSGIPRPPRIAIAPTPDTSSPARSFAFDTTVPGRGSCATRATARSFTFDAVPAVSSASFDGFALAGAGLGGKTSEPAVSSRPASAREPACGEGQLAVDGQADSQAQLEQRFELLELGGAEQGKELGGVSDDAVDRRISFCFPKVPALNLPAASASKMFSFSSATMAGEGTPALPRTFERTEEPGSPMAGVGDLQPMDSSPSLACFAPSLAGASSCTFGGSPGGEEVSTLETSRFMASPMSVDGTPTPTPRRRAMRIPIPTPSSITPRTAQRVPVNNTTERKVARRVPVQSSGSKFKGKREVKMSELDENTARAGTTQTLVLARSSKKQQEQLGAGEMVLTPVRRSTRSKNAAPTDPSVQGLLEVTNFCYSPNHSLTTR